MDNFTSISKKKIAGLMRRTDFVEILSISNNSVCIDLVEQDCQVTNLGKVNYGTKRKHTSSQRKYTKFSNI